MLPAVQQFVPVSIVRDCLGRDWPANVDARLMGARAPKDRARAARDVTRR